MTAFLSVVSWAVEVALAAWFFVLVPLMLLFGPLIERRLGGGR